MKSLLMENLAAIDIAQLHLGKTEGGLKQNNNNKSKEKRKAVGSVASRTSKGSQEGIKSKIQSKDQEPRTCTCCF